MIRRPPSSTLFPSPTLFRSRDTAHAVRRCPPCGSSARRQAAAGCRCRRTRTRACRDWRARRRPAPRHSSPASLPPPPPRRSRSEEHTSELQSRLHLVCRLLLEKKRNKSRAERRPSCAGIGLCTTSRAASGAELVSTCTDTETRLFTVFYLAILPLP